MRECYQRSREGVSASKCKSAMCRYHHIVVSVERVYGRNISRNIERVCQHQSECECNQSMRM